MKETFMLVRKQRQEKRNHNKEQSTNLLKQAEISFESKNSGNHLIILSTPKIDFYPSTGLCISGDKLSKPKAQGYFRRPESTPRKTRLPVLHRAGI